MSDQLSVYGFHDGHACGVYRVLLPFEQMRRAGHDVDVHCGWNEKAREHRIIVGQRISRYGALPIWRRLRAQHRLVYETDDDLWSIDPTNFAAKIAHTPDVIDATEQAIAAAHLVTVSTEALAQVLRRFHDNVVVLPNHIPAALLELERPRPERVTVGWAGGDSHLRDMAMIAPQLRRFFARNPDVELHTIGTDFRKIVRIPGRYTEWNPDIWAYYRSIDFDIGLAPLVDSVFNRSKCVDLSMRISTDRGVLEAGALKVGMKVWRNGWRRIEAVRQELPRPGLLVTLASGYQLRLTPEHRMMVNGDWRRADRITVSDRIAMESETVGPTSPVRVPWPADSRMSRAGGRTILDPRAFLSAPDGPRLDISPRWGRLLGAFAGDGSVGQSTVVQISCDGQDPDWIEMVMADLRACGLNPTTEAITTYDGEVLRRRGVRVASAHLLRVLASLGVTRPRDSGNPIRVPCVPEVIWRSPKDVIAEFLAGYFEADGHCTHTGVKVDSKDEWLIRDVQRLLLLFGITSTVRSRVGRAQNGFSGTYWSCALRRAETDVFAKEIGFRSARKRARLAEITGRPHSNAYRPMEWSREVVSVEPCMVTPVDIQVEGSTFVLAGFVSHNSAIKALEYAALGIPTIATDSEPYREFVVDGETGFLIRQPHEWSRRLRELTHDHDMRAEMGAKAKAHAARWTYEDGYHRWVEAYRSLL